MDSIKIIHISDIHRDKVNPISNEALLASLLLDIEKYKDLGIEKNQSEIARQLYEVKGQIREINGKNRKDRLYKHYLRCEE